MPYEQLRGDKPVHKANQSKRVKRIQTSGFYQDFVLVDRLLLTALLATVLLELSGL